jgi:hypothetical protein
MTTCERCGESNPAEIHTCTPKSEEGCAECGKKASDGWALYCVKCSEREWQGLTDEVIWLEYQRLWPFHPAEEPTLAKDIVKFASAIEAKLKEKNA